MKLVFKPWRPFRAVRHREVDRRFLDAVAHEFEDAFKANLSTAKSGVWYPRFPRRSSAPGEFPANQFGPLRDSIRAVSNSREVTGGSNVKYSKFLRGGTTKMAARKMSPEAMDIAVPKARSILKGWVTWEYL